MASHSKDFVPAGAIIGRRVVRYDIAPSTMDMALEEAKAGAIEGTLVIANEQTSGRGRCQRIWISPPGSISFSLVLYPKAEELPQMVMLSALAVSRTISRLYSLPAVIKWPNDVLVRGKKVAGILVENSLQGERLLYTIVGIGINANVSQAAIATIPGDATSLLIELGQSVSTSTLMEKLTMELDRLYRILRSGAREAIYQEWSILQTVLGKPVVVESGGHSYRGRAERVSLDGRLWLREECGNIVPFSSGEVSLCRLGEGNP